MMNDYHMIDKSAWLDGPWKSEPDKATWQASGLPCMAIRTDVTGVWCGYVGVTESHPLYGAYMDSIDVRVHGGLTYSDHLATDYGNSAHVAQQAIERAATAHRVLEPMVPGLPWIGMSEVLKEDSSTVNYWWFGFDCGHCFDYQPLMAMRLASIGHRFNSDIDAFMNPASYKTLAYVREQCEQLAVQLKQYHAR